MDDALGRLKPLARCRQLQYLLPMLKGRAVDGRQRFHASLPIILLATGLTLHKTAARGAHAGRARTSSSVCAVRAEGDRKKVWTPAFLTRLSAEVYITVRVGVHFPTDGLAQCEWWQVEVAFDRCAR